MQSETADFAPGAAICRTGRDIRVVFDSNPFASFIAYENRTSSTKPVALPSEEDRATATDNTYIN